MAKRISSNGGQPTEAQSARRSLPRRAKANPYEKQGTNTSKSTTSSQKHVNISKVADPGTSEPEDKSSYSEPQEARTFEFVTITSQPSASNRNEISKQVRTQAMRDYVRKQTKEAITGVPEVVSRVNLEEPSRYKGRFKLNTWTHKTKIKATNARNAKLRNLDEREAAEEIVARGQDAAKIGELKFQGWQAITPVRLPIPVFSSYGRMDPFNSLAIRLGPSSENLLVHYGSTYRMNSIAVNAEGNFFSFVKEDPALFHSILYLVALHFDLRYELVESPICLYHGGEAFRIINERLADSNAVFSDQTIGAVAMLVNKENLNGKYELSQVHMQGLEMMVSMRGGIQTLRGIFRRIVTWCDFCYSVAWDTQPRFPRMTPITPILMPLATYIPTPINMPENQLKPSHLFGGSSPMVSIINTLRTLSNDLDPANKSIFNPLGAADSIYNLEYDISLLNTLASPDPDPNRCPWSWEAIPLKIAVHLYLWLVVRELPPTSELLYTVVLRLKDSLEGQLPGWWTSNWERKRWLLWILYMGAVASNGRPERLWFVTELGKLCGVVGVESRDQLRVALVKVVLQEVFFEFHLISIWEDVTLLRELGEISPIAEEVINTSFEQFQVSFSETIR